MFLEKVCVPLLSLMSKILVVLFEAVEFGGVLVLKPLCLLSKLFLRVLTALVYFLPHENH